MTKRQRDPYREDLYQKIEEQPLFIRDLIKSALILMILMLAAFLIITFVGQRVSVIGESMEMTLMDGDQLLVDKYTYRKEDPQRFDIIVFEADQDDERYLIKRVIGLPGEKVQILDNVIYINDIPLEESYGFEAEFDSYNAEQPVYLADDEYFVLGDNRNNSEDSRRSLVGNVERSRIIGKAVYRFWPLNEVHSIK